MRSKLIIVNILLFSFLVSCTTGTTTIKNDSTAALKSSGDDFGAPKSKNFLSEINKFKKEVPKESSYERMEIPKVSNVKTNPAPSAITKTDAPELKPVTKMSTKSYRDILAIRKDANKKKLTASLKLPSKIEETTIKTEDTPADGILIDESVVDEFHEDYKPIAEKDGFEETEENLTREDMKNETAPDAKEAAELIPVDKEAMEEFELLKSLRNITDIAELNEAKKKEDIEKLEKLIANNTKTFDVPIVVNSKVEYFLNFFQGRRMRKVFAKWLNRSTKYLPMMRRIFHEKGLPMDLTYLAMIESGFNTSAYSRAHAVGPWQFIRGTGKNYGLRIDHWVDERRDPEKATIAAANYLGDLYKMFDSWYLAAAAYNAGEGKIGRAIKKHKTEDFWEMTKYKYLKRETKNYIPKFLAATLISKDPSKYGFNNIKPQPLYEYDIVDIKDPTDLEVIARSAGVSLKTIKNLNPELRRWYTPPERRSYELKIPKNTKAKFLANFSKLKPTEKISFLTYRIRYGETLSDVARRFGTKVSAIMRTNKIRNARYVRAGIELTIPIRGGTKVASYRKAYKSGINKSEVILVPKGETVSYKVKRGDTLWDIAQRSGVEVTDIINLNNIKSSRIYPGKKIRLYKNPEKVYAAKASKKRVAKKAKKSAGNGKYHTVRRGDSLWSISKKYGVSIRSLKKMNRVGRRSTIRPRQKLLIAKGTSASSENIQVASAVIKDKTHRVRRGDTLWDIAKKYNMGVKEIKRLNNLRGNKIKAGDKLIVK